MTIEEMEKLRDVYLTRGDFTNRNHNVALGEMWKMTVEICKRLDAIEENGHEADGKNYI